jgi:hypothetical protein
MEWSQTDSFQSPLCYPFWKQRRQETHGKAELTFNSMNPKTSNNQPKLINIQLDCHFSGKISTSDDEVKKFFFRGSKSSSGNADQNQ